MTQVALIHDAGLRDALSRLAQNGRHNFQSAPHLQGNLFSERNQEGHQLCGYLVDGSTLNACCTAPHVFSDP